MDREKCGGDILISISDALLHVAKVEGELRDILLREAALLLSRCIVERFTSLTVNSPALQVIIAPYLPMLKENICLALLYLCGRVSGEDTIVADASKKYVRLL